MNENHISKIVLQGFKSIQSLDLDLTNLNVLIGPNGAGKSNFLSLFRMIQQILDNNLQAYISKSGGPDAFLYYGRKKTEKLSVEICFGNNGYKFSLEPTLDNKMMFSDEAFCWHAYSKSLGAGHFESLFDQGTGTGIDKFVIPAIRSWRLYHFHDTGETALVKQRHGINDNETLRPDARNLAAYLFLLRNNFPKQYDRIVKTVRLVAPYFGDFVLRPITENKEQIELEWKEKHDDTPLKAFMFSDGTLRFVCLATMLHQPKEKQPETLIIDEPELGLHPAAIGILAGMLRSVSKEKQVIVATQSADLLSEFEPENVVVSERKGGITTLQRLDENSLRSWFDEYSLGELWKKNIFGGRPSL